MGQVKVSCSFFSRFRKVTCKLLRDPNISSSMPWKSLTRSRFDPVSDPVFFLRNGGFKLRKQTKGPHVVATGCREGGCFAIC